mgnify:CR=1 FL=1
MAIVNGKINQTDTVLLTVPAGLRYAITTILICNTASADTGGSNDTTFDLHFVPQGQSIGAVNQVCKEINVTGAETFTFDTEKMVLSEGDSIVAVSQAPLNLSATVSFLEV